MMSNGSSIAVAGAIVINRGAFGCHGEKSDHISNVETIVLFVPI